MSRGVSRQQQQILGLAAAVSRLHYGEPKAHTPIVRHGYRHPVAFETKRDVCTNLVAHVLGGVCWLPATTLGTRHDTVKTEKTPAARSAVSSIGRAITNLIKRELLTYSSWPRFEYEWGVVLMPAGLAIGLSHELRVAEIERRLWLLKVPAMKQLRPEWHLYEPLPPPEVVLRADSLDDVTYTGSLEPINPQYWTRSRLDPVEQEAMA